MQRLTLSYLSAYLVIDGLALLLAPPRATDRSSLSPPSSRLNKAEESFSLKSHYGENSTADLFNNQLIPGSAGTKLQGSALLSSIRLPTPFGFSLERRRKWRHIGVLGL